MKNCGLEAVWDMKKEIVLPRQCEHKNTTETELQPLSSFPKSAHCVHAFLQGHVKHLFDV